MAPEHEQSLADHMQRAVAELRGLIQQQYPTATFRVSRGSDDPEAVHLWATVDVDDPDEVVDLVLERMMALQIADGLPIFVIPVRPRAGRSPPRSSCSRRTPVSGPDAPALTLRPQHERR